VLDLKRVSQRSGFSPSLYTRRGKKSASKHELAGCPGIGERRLHARPREKIPLWLRKALQSRKGTTLGQDQLRICRRARGGKDVLKKGSTFLGDLVRVVHRKQLPSYRRGKSSRVRWRKKPISCAGLRFERSSGEREMKFLAARGGGALQSRLKKKGFPIHLELEEMHHIVRKERSLRSRNKRKEWGKKIASSLRAFLLSRETGFGERRGKSELWSRNWPSRL